MGIYLDKVDPSTWNVKEYVNSPDFQDNYGHMFLGIEMGIL